MHSTHVFPLAGPLDPYCSLGCGLKRSEVELLCDHGDGDCDKRRAHRGRHDVACDDPDCCEPRALDAETVAAIRQHHFGGF